MEKRSPEMEAYRQHLVLAEQKAQEDYDKNIIALSGGALGISFAFIKDVVAKPYRSTEYLFASWVCWALSITLVLASYFFSHQALRKAIRQVDAGTIGGECPGGVFDKITASLNAIGGLLFLAGIIVMILFVKANLEGGTP